MDIREPQQSKAFKTAAIVIGVLIIALISFSAGVRVGFYKAKFSYAWGENYERNFIGGPRGFDGYGRGMMGGGRTGFFRMMEGRDFRNAHGVTGTILSVSDNALVVKDQDDKENTVSVTDKTLIKRGRDTVKLSDLKAGDRIVIVGKPGDNGVVNADLIRVFDSSF